MQPGEMNSLPSKIDKSFSSGFLCAIGMIMLFLIVAFLGSYHIDTVDREHYAKTQMREFQHALDFYKMDHGSYPTTEAGLKALTRPDKPSSEKQAKDPYIPTIPLDPWGNPYHYVSTVTGYELICWGADGKPGGTGDAADIQCHEREASDSRK